MEGSRRSLGERKAIYRCFWEASGPEFLDFRSGLDLTSYFDATSTASSGICELAGGVGGSACLRESCT
jgi:hypothetical protein